MTDSKNEQRRFNEAFVERTRLLRLQTGRSQASMAELLGVSLDNYKKYEKRTPLPHYLMPRFAAIIPVDVEFLVTGEITRPERTKRQVIENLKRTRKAN
jgi:transcriptional regulator with XRE-family HTH domain